MGDVLEYDFSTSTKGKPPASLAARLATRRSSGAEAPLKSRPPSGRPAPVRNTAESKGMPSNQQESKGLNSPSRPRPSALASDEGFSGGTSSSFNRRGSSGGSKPGFNDDRSSPAKSPTSSAARRGSALTSDASGTAGAKKFRLGQKVECDYKGRGRWLKARVLSVNADGTCDVRYDTGDEESKVQPAAMRGSDDAAPSAVPGAATARLDIGDAVEARYAGRSRWLKARIIGKDRRGWFDVRYEDGEEERDVEPSLVRPIAGSMPPERSSSSSSSFAVGDEVEADFKGKGRWFKAKIRFVNRDGTYDLRYADGDMESSVAARSIRLLPTAGAESKPLDSDAETAAFEIGDEVEARFGGRSKWFKGTIMKRNRDGSYYIRYSDGDEEKAVESSLIRRVSSAVAPGKNSSRSSAADSDIDERDKRFAVGDDVEADFKGKGRWFKAKIRFVNRDGTYDLRYADGDTESSVAARSIRRVGGNKENDRGTAAGARTAAGAESKPLDSDAETAVFDIGDEVEARFGGRSKWFKGTIMKRNRDSTYYIRYSDGDEEKMVDAALIRRISSAVAPGKTTSARSSAVDSDAEQRAKRFSVGDEVEADFKGKGRWFKAKIRFVNRDGTYDLRYADGDTESSVAARSIRALPTAGAESKPLDSDAETAVFDIGDEIEARFAGRSKWFKGTIMKRNRDGTYYIRYSDGDEEKTVESSLIRRVNSAVAPGKNSSRSSAVDSEAEQRGKSYSVGDEVEADFKGKGRWFKAKIRFVNRDGTYDLRYADGDIESGVAARSIRALPTTRSSTTAGAESKPLDSDAETATFDVGDEVEARFAGRSKWFKGTIMKRNRDGTYYIRYSDGDEEKMVDAALIRRLVSAVAPGKTASARRGAADSDLDERRAAAPLQIGDDVEADYKGRGRWLPAVVRHTHRDGSYDVRYADGSTEQGVLARSLRRAGSSSARGAGAESKPLDSDAEAATFEAGDEVEARFGGRSKWFKGTIMKRNRDGTYYIRYSDGDEEKAVDSSLIRKVGRAAAAKPQSRGSIDSDIDERDKPFAVGDEVEADFKGKGRWFKAKIRFVNRDGTYDLRYADGDSESSVAARSIRRSGGNKENDRGAAAAGGSERKPAESDTDVAAVLEPGDEVEARFGGRSRWFKGTIMKRNRDATYWIKYADGDEEKAVDAALIRRVAAARSSRSGAAESDADDKRFAVGDDVEADFEGKGRWFKAKVRFVNRDGSYDLRYADGDSEASVPARRMRRLGSSDAPASSPKRALQPLDSDTDAAAAFEAGDEVEARFGGRSKWFKGTVMKRNRDGTHYVRYADGDEEKAVEGNLIRRVVGSAAAAASESERVSHLPFKLGAAVEARYRGKSHWLQGTVTGIHRDGSYDVRYEDSGEVEQRVPARLVRAAAALIAESEAESVKHKLGAAVELRRSSSGRRARATVTGIHRDGTYDVRYESDGAVEERVAAVRLAAAAAAGTTGRSDSEAEPMRVGAAVEARRAGGRSFSRATVTAVHRDGTCDVRYADGGDTKQRLAPRLLRLASTAAAAADIGASDAERSRSPAKLLLKVGAAVEGRYKGRSAWLRGSIAAVHRDGTVDVRYTASGDTEERVAAKLVRAAAADSDTGAGGRSSSGSEVESSSRAPLTVGAAVQARYKGSSRAAPATVTAVHRDGSCNLRYEDGRSESRVPRGHVTTAARSRSPAGRADACTLLLRRVHTAATQRHAGGLQGLKEALKSKAARDSFGRRTVLSAEDWRAVLDSHLQLRVSASETRAVLASACCDKQGRIKLADFVAAVEKAPAAAAAGSSSMSESDGEGGRGSRPRRSKSDSDAAASDASSGSAADEKGSASRRIKPGTLLPRALLKQLKALGLENLRSGAAVAAFTAAASSSSAAVVKEAQFGRLLRKLQLEPSPEERAALWGCLDTDSDGQATLADLLELLLCASAQDDSGDAAAAHKRAVAALTAKGEDPGGRLSRALRKGDPKATGFVSAKDLRRCLEKAEAKISTDDASVIARRLDPAARGHVHSASLLTWLCSGIDTAKVRSKAGALLRAAEAADAPLSAAFAALDSRDTRAVAAGQFKGVLRGLGPALTHAQVCALTAEFAAGDDDDDDVDYRGFLALASEQPDGGSKKQRSRSSSPNKRRVSGSGSDRSADGARRSTAGSGSGSSAEEEQDALALVSRSTRAALHALAARGDAVRKAFAAVAGTGDCSGSSSDAPPELVLTKPGQLRKLLRKLNLELSDEHALSSLAECLDVDGDGRVTYGEFLEFTLSAADSEPLSELHTRLAKDLAAKTQERNARSSSSGDAAAISAPLTAAQVAARAFARFDPRSGGAVSAADFKKGLDRLGCGDLAAVDRALLLARFDPSECGTVRYDQFCAWAGSGCDARRAVAKVGRCLGLLRARSGGSSSSLKKAFAAADENGSGRLSARELRKALRKTLGMPLTDGEIRAVLRELDTDGSGTVDYKELLAFAKLPHSVPDGSSADAGDGLMSRLVSGSAKLLGRTATSPVKKGGKDSSSSDKNKNKKHKQQQCDGSSGSENSGPEEYDSDAENGSDAGDSPKSKSRKHADSGNSTSAVLKVLKQRVAAASRAAAAAAGAGAAAAAAVAEGSDEDAENERDPTEDGGAAHQLDWGALVVARDPKKTGFISLRATAAVFKEGGVALTAEESAALLARFGSSGNRTAASSDNDEGADGAAAAAAADSIAVRPLIKWLKAAAAAGTGTAVDDATLKRLQRHVRGRLGRAFDLRALFQEMACGKGSLSGKSLAKGLKRAGLKIDRSVTNELVALFDRTGSGRMDYTEFQRLVHAASLAELHSPVSPMARARMDFMARTGKLGADASESDLLQLGSPHSAAGAAANGSHYYNSSSSQARVDDEVYHHMVQALEKAFSFYDADSSNSIDVREVESILRSLGQDPTRRELKALMRRADKDRNGVLQFEEFQEAVMPFLMDKMTSTRLTEVEIRSTFDAIDRDRSGTITREEFRYAFVERLQLLTRDEAEALISICDRNNDGTISWEEFAELFKLIDDSEYAAGQMMKPELRGTVQVALLKLTIGAQPDPEEHLSAFLGMPSNCRRSVLAPLDAIAEFHLETLLEPQLDGRGGLALPDMAVKLITTVNEQDVALSSNRAPVADIVSSNRNNATGNGSTLGGTARTPVKPGAAAAAVAAASMMMATLRGATLAGGGNAGSPTARTPPSVKTPISSTMKRRSSLMGAGEHVLERSVTKSAMLQPVGTVDGDDTMQVLLSIKRGTGIPVPDDSRVRDVLQRSLRVCLFYQPPKELDAAADEQWRPQDYFFGNTYKTLAKQDPNKEEVWLFPHTSGEADRKFLVRCSFDDPEDKRARERVFVLLELTCTIRTERGDQTVDDDSVHGPLTNFKAKRRTKAVTADSDSDENAANKRKNKRRNSSRSRSRSRSPRKKRGSSAADDDSDVSADMNEGGSDDEASGSGSGSDGQQSPSRSRKQQSSKQMKGSSKAKQQQRNSRKKKRSSDDDSSENDDKDSAEESDSQRRNGRAKRQQQQQKKNTKSPPRSSGSKRKQQQQRRGRSNDSSGNDDGSGGNSSSSSSEDDGASRMLETEISCGWVLVPLAELAAESETGKRVRYQLQGGTPFARSEIQRSEVMTRRYGWRAVLKAMRVEGLDKSSEIELKVIPVRGLPQEAQDDTLRLPRNIVIAASFAPLVRYYREALASALAARSKGAAGFGCGAGAFSCPVLALFPRLAADPAMQYALAALWMQQKTRHGPGTEGRVKAFEHCVLRAWPAHSHIAARRCARLLAHESHDELEARGQKVRALVMTGDSFRADTPTNAAAGMLGTLGRVAYGGAALKEEQLFVAFSAKEVAFGA